METKAKPKCKLVGKDGNVFNLIGIVSTTLKKAGQPEAAKEMQNRVFQSKSYHEALAIFMEYVDVV